MSNRAVIVRAYSGVFFGYLEEKTTTEVVLTNARHVWSWTSKGLVRKVLTIEDISQLGVGVDSRLSGVTPRVTLADWKVISDCSPEAVKVIEGVLC